MTEQEFNNSLMAPIQFSMASSKIAVEKATNINVKEFAGFELTETVALTSALKTLQTLLPEMTEESKAAFTEIESAEANVFDKLYMAAQQKNHRMLRDLTEDYLNDAPIAKLDKDESQNKLLATIILPFFEEHVAITHRLCKELGVEDMAL